MSLSKPSAPKQRAYIPPPPTMPETIDESVLIAKDRERRRAVSRGGRQSTIVAGNVTPTSQSKTLLGA